MQDDNWVFVWFLGVLFLIIGMIIGFFISKLANGKDTQINDLKKELAQNKTELNEYRNQVNEHFIKSSDLFNQMTGSYRALFMHLASGAENLANSALDLSLLGPPDNESSNEISMSGTNTDENESIGIDNDDNGEEIVEPAESIFDELESETTGNEPDSKKPFMDEGTSHESPIIENQIKEDIAEEEKRTDYQS